MRHGSQWKNAIVLVLSLAAFADVAQSREPNDLNNNLTGEVQFRYGYIGVDGDRGRFREDNWMTDRSTGGIDWLHIENVQPSEGGYKVVLEGRAIHDYDYDLSLLLEKENSHYFKFDFDSKRRYFDGSNEFWRPSGINLAELPDDDFFVDRRNYNVELGLTPPDAPNWVFGWHRLEKDGKEVLLRGAMAADEPIEELLAIPVIQDNRGITDTIYGEVSNTFAEKYNFRLRQEFEQYRADLYSDWRAREADGTILVDDGDISDDHLGYTNWRTMAMLDSFLDEQTYVTANYMYNYLNSNSSFNDPLPSTGDSHYYKTLNGGISERMNVGGLAIQRADFLKISNLDFSAGVRVEDSRTSGGSRLRGDTDVSAILTTKSRLDEVRVAEVLQLVYKGIKRTTLSFEAELEQRGLGWDANYTDSSSASNSNNNLDRKADIDFLDQVYTFKAVHRFNPAVKTTVAYKSKNLERSITNLFRANAVVADYPGWLGHYRVTGNEFLLKNDFRINNTTNATLLYEYIQEEFNFTLGGETADHQTHQGAGSLSLNPTQNLFLVGTFMLENRRINTPGRSTAALEENISTAPGSHPWDFSGNSYSLILDSTYAFNEKTSCTLGFRHTEGLGNNIDAGGDYTFDKVGITLKRQIAANQAVGLGYEFYKFDEQIGGSFDDYKAHAVFVTYSFAF